MRADLHVHTTASDGQHSPSEVIALAQDFDVIAITDHDTTAGIGPAQAAARLTGLPLVVPGIELSTAEDAGDVHLLGYFINPDDAAFQTELATFRDARVERGRAMVARLAELGLPVAWERVEALADGGAVGRPHVARALVEAGYVESVREAFDRYISTGGPAYVARHRLTPEEAIALIHRAGGAAVMAHPSLVPTWPTLLHTLAAAGLDGVEVNHPANSAPTRLVLRAMAKKLGLITTGGSDFHGQRVKPGNTLGCETPPHGAVYALQTRAKQYS